MDATSLAERALALLKKTHKVRNPVLVHTAEDADTATGATAYEFVAVEVADPNGPQYSIILDAKGSPREKVARRNLPAHASLPGHPSLPAHANAGGPSGRITIDPDTNQLTLDPGETLDETITVTIPRHAGAPKADIYFLADTTGSMRGVLAAVQAGAQNILTALNGLGLDLRFGVGNYTDFPPASPLPFTHQLSPTKVTADIASAIGGWSAAGGGDFAEAQLLALAGVAEPPGGAIGWRADARRIVVWFGDAPGHDPICTGISGLTSDVTEASATARLVSEQIVVLAISTANPGLNADPKLAASDYTSLCGAPGGVPGQATRLAAATGGVAVTGINAQTIVDTIIRLITAAVSSLDHVELVPSASIAPFVESIAPPGGYGPLPGDAEHVLKFAVRFRGIPCSEREQAVHGTLDVVADRAVVAAKTVQITVPPCRPQTMRYSVKFVCGTQPEECGCAPVRPGHYATHIAIHNYSAKDVRIRKSFIPLVLGGAVVGREPRVAASRAEDDITLTPHTATMDDCCRISELIFGGATSGLTLGVMEVVASADVAVTAIYTTASTVDVEAVAGTVS